MSSSTQTDLPARGALRALLPALAGHRIMMARTCAAALIEQGSLVTLLTLAAHTVGTAVIEDRAPSAGTVSALVVLVLVRTLMTWREMDLSHDLAYRVLAELRVRVFDGLARSAPARVAGRRSGDLAATAMADVEALEFFYAHTTAQLLASGVVFTGGSAVLATVEPWLLVAVVPVAALLAVAPFADARGRAARGARTRAAAAKLSADTVETVDGLRELLAFGGLAERRGRLAEQGRQVGEAQRAEATWEAMAAAVRDLLIVLAVLGVVAAAAQSVTSGRLHGAWAPAAMALALSVLGPVAESARALSQAVGLRAAAARVDAALKAPALAPPPASPRPLPSGPLGVRLHQVSFDYGGRPVLDGVDLTVRAGQTLALVGASGAGKSTCAHLLARFWDPSEGTVHLTPGTGDPVDVRDLSDAELRRALAVVGQDTPSSTAPSPTTCGWPRPRRTTTSSPKRPGCAASTGSPPWTHSSASAAPPSPAASAPGSLSPARCWPSRESSCSTRPPPTWTTPVTPNSPPLSVRKAALRSSSPTAPPPSAAPTASPSSKPAASPRKAPGTSSPAAPTAHSTASWPSLSGDLPCLPQPEDPCDRLTGVARAGSSVGGSQGRTAVVVPTGRPACCSTSMPRAARANGKCA